MKLAKTFLCVTGFLITTSVSAQGICVEENKGCRDIQTGKLYVQEGNQLVDPETKQVYMTVQPVEINSIKSIDTTRASGNRSTDVARDPATGRILQPGKKVEIQETEQVTETIKGKAFVPGSYVFVPGTSGTVIHVPGRHVPVTGTKTTTRQFPRETTCQGLKTEIERLNQKWSTLKAWDRADVSQRIDKLEGEYQDQCR